MFCWKKILTESGLTNFLNIVLIGLFYTSTKLLTDDINGLIPSTVQVVDVAGADFMNASITARNNLSTRSKKVQKRSSISTILRALTEKKLENTDEGRSGFAGIMTEKRDKVIDYLNYELLILSSVRRLNDTHQLQAGSTRLIRRIVDMKTAQAFCTCLTLLDAVSHCIFFQLSSYKQLLSSALDFTRSAMSTSSLRQQYSLYCFTLQRGSCCSC